MNKILFALLLAYVFASCTDGYKSTQSGLNYKFVIENTDQNKPQINDVVALRMSYKTQSGEIEEWPLFKKRLDKTQTDVPTVDEGLSLMHKGDSLQLQMTNKEFFQFTLGQPVPENVNPTDVVVIGLRLVEVISAEEFERDRQAARMVGEREEDAILDNYLHENNINVEPQLSGLIIIEKREGKGAAPTPGRNVTINYTASFLNGEMFDSSYKRNQPLTFKLGVGTVIQGLEEGVSKMRCGGLCRFIIPSPLAYGDEQIGPVAPFSTLVFDVELVEVE